MSTTYIVADPSFWASIPKTRELTCGRVRFTDQQYVPPNTARAYSDKAKAMLDVLASNQQLIREIRYSETYWHYQLLIGFNL